MAAVTYWYPPASFGEGEVLNYRARALFDRVPAVDRRDFRALLRTAARTGATVLADSIECFGVTMQDFHEAKQAIADAGGRLLLKADIQGDFVRSTVESAPFQRLLAKLPPDYRFSFRPISQVRMLQIPLSSFVRTLSPGSYHIYLMEDAPAEVIAHEVMHTVLDSERYPSFSGGPAAGIWDSALSDVEVEARLVSEGLNDPARLGERCEVKASHPFGHSDFEWVVTHYVAFSLYELPSESTRELLRSRIRSARPQAAEVGEQLIALTDQGQALRSATGARGVYEAVADRLRTLGLADLTVDPPR